MVKEIVAQAPIVVENNGDRCVIRIPGDKPPIGALVMVGVMTLFGALFFSLLFGHTVLGRLLPLPVAVLLVAGVTHFAIKKHGREQSIVIENGRLQALGQSFLLSDISSVELGNAHAKTALMSYEGGIFVGNGLGVGLAAGTEAMKAGLMGGVNIAVESAAKKAFFVRIEYGSKSYYLAKELRAPKARALYAFLTSQ